MNSLPEQKWTSGHFLGRQIERFGLWVGLVFWCLIKTKGDDHPFWGSTTKRHTQMGFVEATVFFSPRKQQGEQDNHPFWRVP